MRQPIKFADKFKRFRMAAGYLKLINLRQVLTGFVAVSVFAFMLTSCKDSEKGVDVSHIEVDLKSHRLDKELAQLDTNHLTAGLQDLKQRHPLFLDFYLDTLMGFGVMGDYSAGNPAVQAGLRPFLAHSDIRGLFDTVARHYPDTKKIDADLRKGFQHLKYYYPDYHVPEIVYIISGLNQWSAFTYDTMFVGVGLDMFLGEHYPFYKAVQLPDYAIRKCKPEYIPVNVFQAVYRDRHPFIMESRTLLDMMVQRGKEQYFLSKVIPFAHDTLRLGFSSAQLQWCEDNEADIYNFFIRQNLLYETNWQKILRYVNDGPNATGMPPESPGNIGTWVGWRIVKAYVSKHPDAKPDDIFRHPDAQRMLQESGYKPR